MAGRKKEMKNMATNKNINGLFIDKNSFKKISLPSAFTS